MTSLDFTHRPGMHARSESMSGSASEDLFSSIAGFDDLAGDDDLSFEGDDNDESRDMLGDLNGSGGRRGSISANGKRPSSTAEKKATHNAVERARRESLNTRFLVLADMLPGMNHVKRASKAAIVNKSIELIRDLQAGEARLAKENEALKAELAALRHKWGGAVSPAPAPTNAAATAAANAAVAADFANQVQQHVMHLQQQAAAANAGNASPRQQNKHESAPSALPTPMAIPALPGFGNVFAHGNLLGLDQQQQQFNSAFAALDTARSDSASPSSHTSSSIPAPPSTAGSVNGMSVNPFAVGSNYFDLASLTGSSNGNAVGSPTSYSSHSPASAAAAAVASSNGNNTAPSPASTNSIQTPANAFSPSSLPNFGGEISTARGTSPMHHGGTATSTSNPAIAAFEASADPSYLAAAYGPRDLAKAQQELQSFIAYQQRMASNPAVQSASAASGATTSGSTAHLPFHIAASMYPFHNSGIAPQSPFCASPTMPNIPAWQMMMAQQAALTAYGGAAQF